MLERKFSHLTRVGLDILQEQSIGLISACQLHNKNHDEDAVAAIVHSEDDHNNG